MLIAIAVGITSAVAVGITSVVAIGITSIVASVSSIEIGLCIPGADDRWSLDFALVHRFVFQIRIGVSI